MAGVDLEKEWEKHKASKGCVDTTKYNKLLDPNREVNKIKVKFLKDIATFRTGDKRVITTEEYQMYSERGYCESAEATNNNTIPAFEWFDKIDSLKTNPEKHRAILKQYEGLNISKAHAGKHKMKWKEEPIQYKDELFAQDINLIGRKKDRAVLEFDEVEGEPDNPKQSLEKLKEVFNHYGVGYIQTTHESKNSDYLWVEFLQELTEEQALDFVAWICPDGARIDLNFCFDKKIFPVMYAEHWKYPGVREMPVKMVKGRKIDFEALKLPKQKIEKTVRIGADGFKYETYQKARDVKEFLVSKGINKKTGEEEFNVDIDKVSDCLIEIHKFKTWFGTKNDYSFNWNGKKFDKDTRGIVKVECEKLLGNYCKRNLVDEIFEKIKRKTKTSKEEFEKDDTNFINLNNGVWDIKQKKLLPHNPKYNFQHIIEVTKDDNPLNIHNCQNWLRFINETLYPEDILVMQEYFGFMLFREYFIKKAMLGVGEQDTGKSVLMDTAIRFIGEKNKTGLSLQKIGGGSDFTKLTLKNKHLNAYDDLSSQDVNDGGAFKVATGGGWISGEEKFGEFQQFRSFAKLFFMGNKIPLVKDNDDLAYFGRYIPIKFDNVPEKLDPFLRKKLWTDEEMSGILNWALEGLYRLLENGRFSYNKTNQEIKSIMEISGSPLVAFSSEVLVKEDNNIISKDKMFEVYSVWCEKNNRPRLSKEMLGRQLTKYCPYIIAEKHKERIWKNAKFKDISNIPDTSDTSFLTMSIKKSKDNNSSNPVDMIKNKVSEEPQKQSIFDNPTLKNKDTSDTFIEKEKQSNNKIIICPKCSTPMLNNKCLGTDCE